jgi:SAM-dependent methyltransferase
MTAIETTKTPGTAAVQGKLWGARVTDWAELQEPCAEPLFEAALAKCGVGNGVRYLDAGCGAGRAAEMAAERGASVSGFDASEAMIEFARKRTPAGDFRIGDLQELPWDDGAFDVVTAFNSLQYAASPVDALREVRRVTRRGGRVAIGLWGDPEKCQAAPYIAAIGSFLPPPPPGAPGPWALSAPLAMRNLIESAGLKMTAMRDVMCPWIFGDAATAARALMSAGVVTRALERAGEQAVREKTLQAIEPYRRRDGSYRIENVFRLAVAEV